MSTAKETNTSAFKHPPKEAVSPYRFTLALLIREFCNLRSKATIDRKCLRDFCVLGIKLIQSPDLSIMELRKQILATINNLHPDIIENFEVSVLGITINGVKAILDAMDSLNAVMNPEPSIKKDPLISRDSVVGLFLRSLLINLDRMSFAEITLFHEEYVKYCKYNIGDGDNSQSIPWVREWPKRQAELFIATQSGLLNNNEQNALEPKELFTEICSLLKYNPDLREAHFLNYLNYLRVKEFCGAMDSLYKCFDKSAILDTKPNTTVEEKSRAFRFAALNLTILHYHFGHKEEALAALKEAIKMAQEAGDNLCLQHAMCWKYCLDSDSRLIDHSIQKNCSLNYPFLLSLGLQSYVSSVGTGTGHEKLLPNIIFENVLRGDIINCQNNYKDLLSSSYGLKSALWSFYGLTDMSNMWTQLSFYLNTDCQSTNKSYYGEGYCQALCRLAELLHRESEYSKAKAVIKNAEWMFPNEDISHNWMLTQCILNFRLCMFHEKLEDAYQNASDILVLNEAESKLLIAELYIHKQNLVEAKSVLSSYKFTRPDVLVRSMILLIEIEMYTNSSKALDSITKALVTAKEHHLHFLYAILQMYLSNVLLRLKMPAQALNCLEKCIVPILSHGSRFDRARVQVLYAKCIVAYETRNRQESILNAIEILKGAKTDFMKCEAYYKVKDVLLLMAVLYNDIDQNENRNKCALEYNAMDKDHPTVNKKSLMVAV